ncbi:MAG: hypothetical protein VYA86_01800 [Candidatus Thermoplasmatota archaeon]|nr:hypothetical protein [Candidatus Thermoplasmatota archaeon]
MARKAAAPGGGKKKRRRRKMRLTLKSRGLKKDQGYTDKVGWSQVSNDTPANTGPVEPQVIRHQCSMCGAMNQIPKPKRSRYKVECANPDCGHVDEAGVL